MKILELRFKNLNSLYGEWLIDFTASEYQSNGIFALTGPTGSGKSTILDAMCLALYGATPRLGKITKNSNELMSRQTGECYAEVVFEAKNKRFRCYWGQHRSRKKADGNLIESKHEIADAISGHILESKKREVAHVIEEKTGMDFDRFTRSILLAQGGFDTFLKADAEQKSKILEQITGTEIYSKISIRVHERHTSEQKKLQLLEAKISGVKLLNNEQEVQLQQELLQQNTFEVTVKQQLHTSTKAILWRTKIHTLNDEIIQLSDEQQQHSLLLTAFTKQREQLTLAIKAGDLEGHYATLAALRHQQQEEQATLLQTQNQYPTIEASLLHIQALMIEAEKKHSQAKKAQKKEAPIIQKVRLLDQQVSDKAQLITLHDHQYQALSQEVSKNTLQQKQNQSDSDTIENNIKEITDYLINHATDELLITQFSAIETQLTAIESLQNESTAQHNQLNNAEKNCLQLANTHTTASNTMVIHREAVTQASEQLELNKNLLDTHLNNRLLREYRSEKEHLLREIGFINTIIELSEERTKLSDDKPCPLCGAIDHPYAQGNIPSKDKTEQKINDLTLLIKKAEQFEKNIKESEKIEQKAVKQLIGTEKTLITADNNHKHAQKAIKILINTRDKDIQQLDILKNNTLIKLQPLNIVDIPSADIKTLIISLKDRLQQWQQQHAKKQELEQDYHRLNSQRTELQGLLHAQQVSLNEKNQQLEQLHHEHSQQTIKRTDLFGTKQPNQEEDKLEQAIIGSEEFAKQQTIKHNDATLQLNQLNNRIATLTHSLSHRSNELEQCEKNFSQYLTKADFTDESVFVASRLSNEQRDQLIKQAKALDYKTVELQGKKQDRETHRINELNKNLSKLSLIELESEHIVIDTTLKQIINDSATLKHRLENNSQAIQSIKEQKYKIDQQKYQCRKWEQLHGLIGSADGKKFRNFAQGLTFELMVSHANKQLEKMTDRYLLIRDDNKPLALNVIDHYQAGEIRSTKNLSGGESFIISLTLALGLSKMASHKVRVDSLFLDEGFGTLDEEALETALETLSMLQQDGKIIGVISHINALKERISTQISIQPLSGGKSSINGPGCQSININK